MAADILGDSVFWDCDRESCHSLTGVHFVICLVPRTREGYYHYTGGIEVRLTCRVRTFPSQDETLFRLLSSAPLLTHLMRTFCGWKPSRLILNRRGTLRERLERIIPEST